MKLLLNTLILALFFATTNHAQTLIPDTLFGNSSQTIVPFIVDGIKTTKLLRNTDNSLLACGYTYELSCNCFNNLIVKFNACGDIDSSFGVNGVMKHTFDQRNIGFDYELQPDGKILCCGTQSDGNAGSQQFPFIARYKSNGTPDSTFGTFGSNKIILPSANDFQNLYLMPDGKILCNNGGFAMRFLPDGTVDNTFANAGSLTLPPPPGVNFYYSGTSVLRPDGKIITANPAYNGIDVYSLVQAYDTLGNMDSTFGTNGSLVDLAYPSAVNQGAQGLTIVQSTNKVIVAAGRPNSNGVHVFRITATGQIDTTFGTNGYIDLIDPVASLLTALIPLSNDKFLIEYNGANGSYNAYFAYNSNGSPDTTFSLAGMPLNFGSYGQVYSAISETNGEITFAASSINAQFNIGVSRFVTAPYVPVITQSSALLHANVANQGCTYQWYLNGMPINGSTDSTCLPSQNGNYMVLVTNIWGCANSSDFVVTGTGIAQLNSNITGVYPNPFNESTTISINDNVELKNANIIIYDIYGKAVRKMESINQHHIKIEKENLTPGVYQFEIVSQNQTNGKGRLIIY